MTMVGPVRGVLAGMARFAGKAYFFAGDRYWRYDLEKDYGALDYPRPLRDWRLPKPFDTGVDACLAGRGRFTGRAYFFKDLWYVGYDWKSDVVGLPRPISDWGALSDVFPTGVDTVVGGGGRYGGKAYIFRRDRYCRYDWESGKIDIRDRPISTWRLGERFTADLTAAFTDEAELGLGYFFKGTEYVKYDWKEEAVPEGYPWPIEGGWPTGCAVFANHSQSPNHACQDARLQGGKSRLAYPRGTLEGQAGWQISIRFRTVKEMADKLTMLVIPEFYGDEQAGKGTVPAGRVTRLAISAHGYAGGITIDGEFIGARTKHADVNVNDDRVLQDTVLRTELEHVREMLAPGARVLLMGCEVGQSPTGGYFLMGLSQLFKDHPVTGFTTVGYSGPQARGREGCEEPGMRDTTYLRHSRDLREEGERVKKHWGDLNAWPWASEASPNAKTALNGELVGPTPEHDVR